MRSFKDKVVVVTGASEGIGRALALELAGSGAKLALAARNRERLEELAAEVEGKGTEALVLEADLLDPGQCLALVDRAAERFGGIDVLANNAGQTMWTRFDEMENLEIFERLTRLNYLAGVYTCHRALPHLKKSKGMIVGVSSLTGLMGVPERTAYCGSKHAMHGFYDALRIELRGSGVKVTVAAPDFVRSEVHRRALGKDGKPIGESPMDYGKVMAAEECARIIVGGMRREKRLVLTSRRTLLGRWAALIAPDFADAVKAREIEKARQGR